MTNNILTIYERLYNASDNIKGRTIDYNLGFQDAVYMLQMALKNHEHINLHLENKKLNRELFLAKLALDDRYEDRYILQKQIDTLKLQTKVLRKEKTVKIEPPVITGRIENAIKYTKVEVWYGAELVTFYINTDQDTFDTHFNDAVFDVNHKIAKMKKRIQNSMLKNWFIEFYRGKGFICSGK